MFNNHRNLKIKRFKLEKKVKLGTFIDGTHKAISSKVNPIPLLHMAGSTGKIPGYSTDSQRNYRYIHTNITYIHKPYIYERENYDEDEVTSYNIINFCLLPPSFSSSCYVQNPSSPSPQNPPIPFFILFN